MKRRYLLGSLAAVGSAGCLRLASDDDTPTPAGDGGDGGSDGLDESDGGNGGSDGVDDIGTPPPSGDVDYPIGLSDDGVEPILVDAHLNVLVGTSFEVSWTESDLTRGRIAFQRHFRVEGGEAIGEWRHQGPVTLHASANGSFWREDLGDVVTYGQDRNPFNLQRILRAEGLRRLIQAGVWERPRPEEREGLGTVFHIHADGVDDPGALEEEFSMSSLESFTADGEVDDSGAILELTADFESRTTPENDRLIRFRVEYSIGSHGSVTVSEPDWFETARERAPDVSARITDDGRFIEMEHAGGNPILPGTDVVLYDRDRRRNWGYRENREPFEAGTTLYLWMADDQLRWQRNDRPADADPQPLDGRYGFWMHRGGAEYFGNIELP